LALWQEFDGSVQSGAVVLEPPACTVPPLPPFEDAFAPLSLLPPPPEEVLEPEPRDPMSFDPGSFDPMSFDPMSFDPMSFDPMSFDPMSFDPISFDPISFDPAAAAVESLFDPIDPFSEVCELALGFDFEEDPPTPSAVFDSIDSSLPAA
jgi:hypothetical protein